MLQLAAAHRDLYAASRDHPLCLHVLKSINRKVRLLLQVSSDNQKLTSELSQLHSSHKQLKEEKEATDTELSTLQPAHAELKQMHDKVSSELQTVKTALQKSQEARVRAEVSACQHLRKSFRQRGISRRSGACSSF